MARPPLPELEPWEPGRTEAERLTELRRTAEEVRLEGRLLNGTQADVVPDALAAVREQPLRERRWALLARAQYRAGQQADALATLRAARQTLLDELGLDPGPELVDLERAILAQDPGLDGPEAPEAPETCCPYPGLAPFDVDDAEFYFGREEEVQACVERLERTGLLAVVGASGSGKSSLVRAGIAASLRRGGRTVHVLTPGRRPLDALPAPGRRGFETVWIVDQFEELFTLTDDLRQRADFMAAVSDHAGHGGVVLALRADRLGDITAHPTVARQVEEGLYLLGAMDEESLRRGIEAPAQQLGLLLEDGLVDLLVRDALGEPGALPLLGHALRETWERREGRRLTVAGYRASGGIRGAIAQTAERLYEEADPDQRDHLRELVLRLVQPGPAGEPVRVAVPRQSLAGDAAHAALLEQLIQARLVTVDSDRVQIAHEALARAWPRLQAWLGDDIGGQRVQRHLAATAEAWDAMGRPDTELYRGARLVATVEWRDTGRRTLTEIEAAFLTASERQHAGEAFRAREAARRERRHNRVLRVLVAGVTVLALAAAGFGSFALVQSGRAENEAARARANELAASVVQALDEDPSLAKALAVAAADAAPLSTQSRKALHRAGISDPVVARVSMHEETGRMWAVLSPDGTRVAMTAESVADGSRSIEVHDARTGRLVWRHTIADAVGMASYFVAGAAWTPDGRYLVGGVVRHDSHEARMGPSLADQPAAPDVAGVYVWDATSFALVKRIDVGACGAWPVEAGGSRVLVRSLPEGTSCSSVDGLLVSEVLDLDSGDRLRLGAVRGTISNAMTLSADGSTAATLDEPSRSTLVWDVDAGREVLRLPQDGNTPRGLNRAGDRLVVFADPVTYNVLSVPDGRTVTSFTGHVGVTIYAQFAPDGSTVLSTGASSGDLRVWDAATGQEQRRVPLVGEGRPSVAAGGLVLIPRPSSSGATLLDLSPRGEGRSWPGCPDGFLGADAMRRSGDLLVLAAECGATDASASAVVRSTFLTHSVSGRPGQVRDGGAVAQAFEVSPDGATYLTQHGSHEPPGRTGALQVRDVVSGDEVLTLEGFCDNAMDSPDDCRTFPETPFEYFAWRARWSPDGRWIAATDPSSGLAVWDARTGRLVSTPGRRGGVLPLPWELIFTPDSARLIVTYRNADVVSYDTGTWQEVRRSHLAEAGAQAVGPVDWTPDGSLVAVAPYRSNEGAGRVLVLDPDTLRVRAELPQTAASSVRAAALSPDGTRVALATNEGSTWVWDLPSRTLVDEVHVGQRVQGLVWLDDRNIALGLANTWVVTISLDAATLLATVRSSIVSGLDPTDCARYGFGTECPDLATLRGTPSTDPGLDGEYRVAWNGEELLATVTSMYTDAYGARLSAASRARAEAMAAVAGTFRLTIDGGSYLLTRDGQDSELCRGDLTVAEGRLALGVHEGSWCRDFQYLDAAFRLEGGRLVLPPEEFRGPALERVLFATKPWERVR